MNFSRLESFSWLRKKKKKIENLVVVSGHVRFHEIFNLKNKKNYETFLFSFEERRKSFFSVEEKSFFFNLKVSFWNWNRMFIKFNFQRLESKSFIESTNVIVLHDAVCYLKLRVDWNSKNVLNSKQILLQWMKFHWKTTFYELKQGNYIKLWQNIKAESKSIHKCRQQNQSRVFAWRQRKLKLQRVLLKG